MCRQVLEVVLLLLLLLCPLLTPPCHCDLVSTTAATVLPRGTHVCNREYIIPLGFRQVEGIVKFYEDDSKYELKLQYLESATMRYIMVVDGQKILRTKMREFLGENDHRYDVTFVEDYYPCFQILPDGCIHFRSESYDYFAELLPEGTAQNVTAVSAEYERWQLPGKDNYHTMLNSRFKGYYAYHNKTTGNVHFLDYRTMIDFANASGGGDAAAHNLSRPPEMVIVQDEEGTFYALPWDQANGRSVFTDVVPHGLVTQRYLFLFTSDNVYVLRLFDVNLQFSRINASKFSQTSTKLYFACTEETAALKMEGSIKVLLATIIALVSLVLVVLLILLVRSRRKTNTEYRIRHGIIMDMPFYKYKAFVINPFASKSPSTSKSVRTLKSTSPTYHRLPAKIMNEQY